MKNSIKGSQQQEGQEPLLESKWKAQSQKTKRTEVDFCDFYPPHTCTWANANTYTHKAVSTDNDPVSKSWRKLNLGMKTMNSIKFRVCDFKQIIKGKGLRNEWRREEKGTGALFRVLGTTWQFLPCSPQTPLPVSVNMSQDKAPWQLPLSPSHMQPWLPELRKPGVTGHGSFAHVLWRFERSWFSGAVAEFPEQTRKAIWGRHENSANSWEIH